MVPADDMPDFDTQRETFIFANAVPQAAGLNPHAWAAFENGLHNLAQDVDEGLFIVTGAIYLSEQVDRLNARVAIPTHVFKAVYDPAGDRAAAFIAENTHDSEIEQISLAALEAEFGVAAFPALPEAMRTAEADWPLPAGRRACLH
jgi:endonuclease G